MVGVARFLETGMGVEGAGMSGRVLETVLVVVEVSSSSNQAFFTGSGILLLLQVERRELMLCVDMELWRVVAVLGGHRGGLGRFTLCSMLASLLSSSPNSLPLTLARPDLPP